MSEVYAEEVPYWKTGSGSPEKWLDKSVTEIERAEGDVVRQGDVTEYGRSAFLIEFSLSGETFKVMWPVLESRSGDRRAARRQAATMLYHDTKSRCIASRVLGVRAAFMPFMVLLMGE